MYVKFEITHIERKEEEKKIHKSHDLHHNN